MINTLLLTGIENYDYPDAEAADGSIVLKKNRRLTLEERAARYGGVIELDEEADWGKPVGREIW